jgi:antirestriction protein ArdC
MNQIYQIITNKIIEKLEQGTVPWQKTWKTSLPKNFVSDVAYKGINQILLGMQDFESHYWLSFRQVKDLSGWVKKGEQSSMVVFWKPLVNNRHQELDEVSADVHFLLRYYNVFNIEQVELPDEIKSKRISESVNTKIHSAENIVMNYPKPPAIICNNTIPNPRYLPRIDRVEIQSIKNFNNSDSYYSSLFHELVHSTGHQERLARKGITDKIEFGTEKYSKEELIAEIGASFLSSLSGVENTIDNQTSYIENWLQVLQNDKRMLLIAASQAQKACDWILNNKNEVNQ